MSVTVRSILTTITEWTPPVGEPAIFLSAQSRTGAFEQFDMGRTVKVVRETERDQDDVVRVFVTFPTNAREVHRLVSAQAAVIEFLEQYAPEALAAFGPVKVLS